MTFRCSERRGQGTPSYILCPHLVIKTLTCQIEAKEYYFQEVSFEILNFPRKREIIVRENIRHHPMVVHSALHLVLPNCGPFYDIPNENKKLDTAPEEDANAQVLFNKTQNEDQMLLAVS